MTLYFRERAQTAPFVQNSPIRYDVPVIRHRSLGARPEPLADTAMDERQLVPFVAASPEADPKNLRNLSETRTPPERHGLGTAR